MSKNRYMTVYALGRPGGKTIRPGKPVDLTDEEAGRLLEKGTVVEAPVTVDPGLPLDLLELPEAEFEAALAGLKLAELKTIVASHGMAEGDAKSKADFIAVIKAAREKARQQSGT